MNDIDRTTFDRFAKRFSAIERLVPNPQPDPGIFATSQRRRGLRSPLAALAGAAVLMAGMLMGLALIGPSLIPLPGPSSPAPSPPPSTGEPTDARQDAHPLLFDTYWAVTELDGTAISGLVELYFPRRGTLGGFSFVCGYVAFEYGYDPDGASITMAFDAEHFGSTGNCSSSQIDLYVDVIRALPRIAAWRSSGIDEIEFLEANGTVMLRAGPVQPIASAPPGGKCGGVPPVECERAASLAFNFGLLWRLDPGQTVVGWTIGPALDGGCAYTPFVPTYDITFELENEAAFYRATVGEADGHLRFCSH